MVQACELGVVSLAVISSCLRLECFDYVLLEFVITFLFFIKIRVRNN